MTDTPGSFGKDGQFGLTTVPVQQVQHVHVTDSVQDLSPAMLSLWLSLCSRLDSDVSIKRALSNSYAFYMVQIGGHSSSLVANSLKRLRYCGVLLPMVETYPLLKVYEGPFRMADE